MTRALMMSCLALVLTSGCMTTANKAPVEDRTGQSAGKYQMTEPGSAATDDVPEAHAEVKPYVAPEPPQPTPVKAKNPAVTSLASIADNKMRSGDYDAAAAALERALRHEPQDAELWHRLAEVRLLQHQPEQAESTALKSNTLANGDKSLMIKNWRLISKSRRLRGDGVGADEAEVRAWNLGK